MDQKKCEHRRTPMSEARFRRALMDREKINGAPRRNLIDIP